MKSAYRIFAVATLASSLMAPATPMSAQSVSPLDRTGESKAIPPPEIGPPVQLLYVVPGVEDLNSVNRRTLLRCANTSTVSESIRFVIRQFNGVVVGDQTKNVISAATHTATTGSAPAWGTDTNMNTLNLGGGLAFIFGTSQFIFCTAMIVDGTAGPGGVALHVVRFGPLAGTQE